MKNKIIIPQNKIITGEKAGIKGEYTKFCLAPWVKKNSPILNYLREYIRTGNKKLLEALLKSGEVRMPQYAQNLIPTVGRAVLAELLVSGSGATYTGEVDYGALGDGATAFTNASTQLNNEIYRTQASSQVFDDNIVTIDWFVASGDTADDTFEEFGAFIDGSAAADSGQAFSLLITGGWVKAGSMFISGKYTIS